MSRKAPSSIILLAGTVLAGIALAAVATVYVQQNWFGTTVQAQKTELEHEDEDDREAPSPEFFTAAERLKLLTVSDTETLLKLYGLFKRTTVGLAKAKDKPWEPTARAKWSAWNDCRDLTRQEAASLYVDLVKSIDKLGAGGSATQKKLSLGPKVSKMVTTETNESVVEFAGSELFDQAREDFSKLGELLDAHPELLHMHDEEHRTLLHWAVDSDCLEAVVLLLERGAEIDPADSEGYTPLGYAAENELASIAIFLLSAGADAKIASRDQPAADLTRDPKLKAELR